MKYKIKILKLEEKKDTNENRDMRNFYDNQDMEIFKAGMDSDACIEILQHLHDLNSRKNDV